MDDALRRRSGPSSLRLTVVARVVRAFGLTALLVGCQTILIPSSQTAMEELLAPIKSSPDNVTLEIFHARIPIDKEDAADKLWNEIDEQCFDASLRAQLLENGLRAGVVGGTLPETLASILTLESEAPKVTAERLITGDTAVPQVTRRVVQIGRRDQTTIQTSEVQEHAQVLISEDGRLHGKSYDQLQAAYVLEGESIEGQKVRVRLTPELQHGELRNRYSGSDQGLLLLTPSREREVFDRLAMETVLAPGEAVVLGCLPDAGSNLGAALHASRTAGRHERKVIVVRVLETPPSEILAEK
jgi:hypothetical protein